ncbi:MAG: metal-dependent hydrolase [Piscirickettsiaceae bacterium]|nr:MAG: metal-dependent hydrolase [Piscirickettsiaceae bacterium]
MESRKLKKDEISKLFPIRNLSDSKKQHLLDNYQTIEAPANTVIFSQGSNDTRQIYLLEGEVRLTSKKTNHRIIKGGALESRFPMGNSSPRKDTAVAITPVSFFVIEKSELNKLNDDKAPVSSSVNVQFEEQESENSLAYNQLYFEVSQEIQNNRLEIPSIPDTAIKVRKAISDHNISSDKIARITQVDPAITAQLIKVANSPLFRGREKIESLPPAITRLGLKAIGNLITSFTMRMVFNAKTKDVKQHISQLWLHSRDVAGICAVMAKKLKGFDPDKALLAGLVHDIGAIPVLTHADKHPNLMNNASEAMQAVAKLTPTIGSMVLKKWNFTEDFQSVALHAENWQRETDQPGDYTDLIIVAQLLSYENTNNKDQYPMADTVPAYQRLVALLKDSADSIRVTENARDELIDVQQLFN